MDFNQICFMPFECARFKENSINFWPDTLLLGQKIKTGPYITDYLWPWNPKARVQKAIICGYFIVFIMLHGFQSNASGQVIHVVKNMSANL